MENPRVSIIILNYNGGDFIEKCLNSVINFDYKSFEVIVIDNGSTDNSPSLIQEKFPQIKLIRLKKNLGFCKGNNLGMRYAKGDCFFFVNNDMIFHKDLITILVKELYSAPDIGIVGPKIYYMDEPKKVWFAGGVVDWQKSNVYVIGKEKMDYDLTNDIKREINYITGGALMIKREVVNKIGKMWAILFAYYEDCEWCIRAKKFGYKVIYIPFGGVWHAKSLTSSRFFWDDLKKEYKKATIFIKPIVAFRTFGRWLFQYMIRKDFRVYKNKFLFFMRHAPIKYKLKYLLKFIFIETPLFLYLLITKIFRNIIRHTRKIQ